jgi:outer membrane protein OmpA-like peptidoglycan-associated protein
VPGGEEAVTSVLAAEPPQGPDVTPGATVEAPEPAASTAGPAWPLWIGVAVLAVALIAGGAWLATRNGDDGDSSNSTVTSAVTSARPSTTGGGTTNTPESTAPVSTEPASTAAEETTSAPTTIPAAVQQMNDIARGTLVFEPNSTTLGPDAGPALDQIAGILNDQPDLSVFVDGHTDNQGDPDENLQLSELRANVVVAELTARGVNRDRLTPRGFGGERPIADNGTDEGQAANRRIEFTYRP